MLLILWEGPSGFTSTDPTISFIAGEHFGGVYRLIINYQGCQYTYLNDVLYHLPHGRIIVEKEILCVGESMQIAPISGGSYTLSNPNIGMVNGGTFLALENGFTQVTYTSDATGCESEPINITVLNCIEPTSSCAEISADDIICDFNELINIGGTLSDQKSEGNQPIGELCDDGDGADNISWLGFVALEGDYEIVVNINDCTPYVGGVAGAQVGIYSDCNFSELTKIFCESTQEENDQIRIPSDMLTKGQTYFYI